MRKLATRVALSLGVSAALAVAAPGVAQAHYLSKKQAKDKTAQIARSICADLSWCQSWAVEPSYECSRWSDHAVLCDYSVTDWESGGCESQVLVRYRSFSRRMSVKFIGKPICF